MLTTDELTLSAMEADLRTQRLNESIAYTQALAGAVQAATTADQLAATAEAAAKAKELAASNADGDSKVTLTAEAAALRATADAAQAAAIEAKKSAQEARIKARLYQDTALKIGAPERVRFRDRLGEALCRVGEAVVNLSAGMWLALIGVVGVIIWVVSSHDAAFLIALSKPDTARALIMVLILGTTLLLAVILSYQAYATGTTNEQFRMAREIYTTLIGVVGTVVGFYFGSVKTETPPQYDADVVVTENAVNLTYKDEKLTATVVGGKAPYKWTLLNKAAPAAPLKSAESADDGRIEIPVDAAWKGMTLILKVTESGKGEEVSAKITIPKAASNPPTPASGPTQQSPEKKKEG